MRDLYSGHEVRSTRHPHGEILLDLAAFNTFAISIATVPSHVSSRAGQRLYSQKILGAVRSVRFVRRVSGRGCERARWNAWGGCAHESGSPPRPGMVRARCIGLPAALIEEKSKPAAVSNAIAQLKEAQSNSTQASTTVGVLSNANDALGATLASYLSQQHHWQS